MAEIITSWVEVYEATVELSPVLHESSEKTYMSNWRVVDQKMAWDTIILGPQDSAGTGPRGQLWFQPTVQITHVSKRQAFTSSTLTKKNSTTSTANIKSQQIRPTLSRLDQNTKMKIIYLWRLSLFNRQKHNVPWCNATPGFYCKTAHKHTETETGLNITELLTRPVTVTHVF